MPRYGGFLGLDWEYVSRFQHKVEMAKVPIDNLQNSFIYWLGGPGRGSGALTKRLADHFTAYVQSRIISQQAFRNHPSLSPMWIEMKNYLGLDPRMGIAKGHLVNAIKPLDTGYGKYRVGISKNEVAPDAAGGIKNVAEYAILLEKGYTTITKKGKRKSQPPRPFFSESFLRWSQWNLPEEIATSIHRDIWPELKLLYERVGKNAPRFDPDAYYKVDTRKGASEAEEVIQETGQTGQREYMGPGADTELGSGEPGVTGEEDAPGQRGAGFFESVKGGVPDSNKYPESQRESKSFFREGVWQTTSGDIFDQDEEMWMDAASFYNKHYGGLF